jgi:hypothetical protein
MLIRQSNSCPARGQLVVEQLPCKFQDGRPTMSMLWSSVVKDVFCVAQLTVEQLLLVYVTIRQSNSCPKHGQLTVYQLPCTWPTDHIQYQLPSTWLVGRPETALDVATWTESSCSAGGCRKSVLPTSWLIGYHATQILINIVRVNSCLIRLYYKRF